MITIIILSAVVLIGILVIINLLRKAERLDEELTDVSLTLADVLTTIEQSYIDMQTIDSRGAFKSDDEIGTIFNGLKQEIDMLREKYIGEGSDGE